MSTPVKTCQPQGGIRLERDSTGPPTPTVPPSSVSKRYISSGSTCQSQGGVGLDIPALPAGVYFGCAAAVNGDATLSCPSPPHLATGDFGRPWRCLPCSSALGFYFDDTGLSIPLSSSLPPAHLQSSSYLLSPQDCKDLPRCRRRFRRSGQQR
jgi:hypothetical protein